MVLRRIGRGEWSARGNAYGRPWIPPSRPSGPRTATAAAVDTFTLSDLADAIRSMLASGADAITFGDTGVADTLALLGVGEDSLTLSDAATAFVNMVAAALDALTVSDSAVASTGGTEPFVWYPGLDLNAVPWYTGAGAWGSQYVIQPAAAPTTTTEANPTNFAQFEAALVSGTRINIGAGVTIDCGNGTLLATGATLSDIDIVIDPAGALLYFRLGSYGSDLCTYDRIRVRGPTVGAYSGGQLHQFGAIINGNASSSINDVILDGIGVTGGASDDVTATTAILMQTGSTNSRRFNMVNCRLASGGEGYLGDMADTIQAGNSILTALTNPEPVEDEAWGSRIMGYIAGGHIAYANDVRAATPGRTNVFHRFRIHPGVEGSGHYWLANNLMVDLVEARMLWCIASAGSLDGWLESLITDGNTYYAEGVGLSYYSESAIYNSFSNETFYSSLSLSAANLVVASEVNPDSPTPPGISTTKVTSNLTFNGAATPPAWGAAGDPSGLNWNI